MSQSYEIDMCHGPLFGKIIRFSIPLMLSGILQLLFNSRYYCGWPICRQYGIGCSGIHQFIDQPAD